MAITKISGTGNRKTRRTDETKGVPAQFVSPAGEIRKGFEEAVDAYKALAAANNGLSQADILGHAVILLAQSEGL